MKINMKTETKKRLALLGLLATIGYGTANLISVKDEIKDNSAQQDEIIAMLEGNIEDNAQQETSLAYLDEHINEILDQQLEEYIDKRDTLEKEIADLEEQKAKLEVEEEFELEDLIVMENEDNYNETSLCILDDSNHSGICEEYHHSFEAWYNLHEDGRHTDSCLHYIHFYEGEPLFNYLTEEEKQEVIDANGIITTSQLDKISDRINSEYKENNSPKTLTKK